MGAALGTLVTKIPVVVAEAITGSWWEADEDHLL